MRYRIRKKAAEERMNRKSRNNFYNIRLLMDNKMYVRNAENETLEEQIIEEQ